MTNEEINAKVIEIKRLEAHIKDLKASVDSIKQDLQREMDTKNVELIDTGVFRLWWKLKETCSFDVKKFKEKYNELYEEYCRRDCTTMFTITTKKED